MHILFIDLASHHGLLACVTEQRVVAAVPVDHRVDDGELLTMLEKLLQDAGWQFADLTHVACIIGPGGFMSLRVAVSLANTLVHHLNIPGTGVHLSDLYAARIPPPPLGSARGTLSHRMGEGRVRDVLWIHSTKKHELFVRGFGEYAKLWPEARHVVFDDFLSQAPASAPWVGELIPEQEKLVLEKGMKQEKIQTITDVLPSFLKDQMYGPETLEPWYGREG